MSYEFWVNSTLSREDLPSGVSLRLDDRSDQFIISGPGGERRLSCSQVIYKPDGLLMLRRLVDIVARPVIDDWHPVYPGQERT